MRHSITPNHDLVLDEATFIFIGDHWAVHYHIEDLITGTKTTDTLTFDRGGINKSLRAVFDELVEFVIRDLKRKGRLK